MNKRQLNLLKTRCNQSISSFHSLGQYTPVSKNTGYTFIDRGSNVLGIAHLDTVQQSDSFFLSRKQGELLVHSPKLDDRLGVFTLLDVLPSMGLNFDVLLTEGEESAQSTAIYFESKKQYNWMFEFDRFGHTTVLYQYDSPDIRSLLTEYGFVLDRGIYTDITDLSHLGCVGFNFSTGYYDYHALKAYCVVSQWQKSVNQFVQFYSDYKDVFLEFVDFAEYDDLWLSPFDTIETFCSLCQTDYTNDIDLISIEDTGVCSQCAHYLSLWAEKYP